MLGDDELAHYDEHGWVGLGAVLTADEVEGLLAEERRFRLRIGAGTRQNRTLRVNQQLCHRSAPVRAFATEGRHLDAVVQLLGPDVALTHQQFIAKLPDDADTASDIPFHQDNGYGRLDPLTDVTVWVALHDTDEANGCLWIVSGSHTVGVVEHRSADINPFLRDAGVDTSSAVPVPMRAGEAVAFTGQTVHGSGPNHTDAERVGLFVRYCEPTAIMVSEGNRPVLDDPHSWMVAGEAP